jgi:hypothetical protein
MSEIIFSLELICLYILILNLLEAIITLSARAYFEVYILDKKYLNKI